MNPLIPTRSLNTASLPTVTLHVTQDRDPEPIRQQRRASSRVSRADLGPEDIAEREHQQYLNRCAAQQRRRARENGGLQGSPLTSHAHPTAPLPAPGVPSRLVTAVAPRPAPPVPIPANITLSNTVWNRGSRPAAVSRTPAPLAAARSNVPAPQRAPPPPVHLLPPPPIAARNNAPEVEQPRGVGEDPGDVEDEYEEDEARRIDKMKRGRLFMAARKPYVDPPARHDFGEMSMACPKCHALHWDVERLSKSSRVRPRFGMCCMQGKVALEPIPAPPEPLRTYLSSLDQACAKFREESWKYNRSFAFTSLGVREDYSVNRGNGPPVFRIRGELHHRSGALTAPDDVTPRYSQLYIVEPRAAVDHRMQQNAGLDLNIMAGLDNMLRQHHQYVPVYRHAYEILREYRPEDDASIRLRLDPHHDKRTFNFPTADEVAVILPGTAATTGRDIVLRMRQTGYLDRISELHPAYTPLQYPLLFPHGTNGWHQSMYLEDVDDAVAGDEGGGGEAGDGEDDPRKLTLMRWSAYRMMYRVQTNTEFNTLLRGGRLFSRFVVDMYAAIDQQRLRWITLNQSQFRTARLNHLEDANMNDPDNLTAQEIGKRVYLPSSYTGGPRNMGQCFQDSMAIARFFGSVDLFLTMTCNPLWPEITRELLPGQTAYDRPDLVARVFRMKQKQVVEYIQKNGIFGVPAAYVYTIEFQKRGLPHMHMLIFLRRGYKLITPELIDSCISAEWPDPETQPLLFETVKHCMVHGPCGAENPNAPCMVNGKCSKGFPKAFQDRTSVGQNGYANYRRRNDGRAFEVRGKLIDNRWLVPYPPFLCGLFDCHINLECCVSINSIQYIFKYIQKGPDHAALEIEQKDEVKKYLEGRYVSPPDAAWRIFAFPIHQNVPKVQRLQIHLPGQHMVTFREEEDIEDIVARGAEKVTTLTAFFQANADEGDLGELARTLTYQQFPQKMVYNQKKKRWSVRQGGFAIGRMFFVKPTAGAIFHLRTLLTVVKGPRSFEDLRRVPGLPEPLPTFYDACVARGLLHDDGEWRLCLREASQMQIGLRLRHLFASLLLFGEVTRPELLWAEFRTAICSDLERALLRTPAFQNAGHIPEETVFDYGLYLLDNILQTRSKSLRVNFPSMPSPQIDWALHTANPLIVEQLSYDRQAEAADFNTRYPLLNDGQRLAADTIRDSIAAGDGRTYFLKGSAGTGKTFVYNTLCAMVRAEGLIILCVSSSGISALLIRGGRTAHSTFGIPIRLDEASSCSVARHDPRAELMRRVRAIIWDEVGAQHRHAVEAVDRMLRDVRHDPRPFGGVTTILGGDFLQTLPVVVGGSREEIVNATLQRSRLWDNTTVLTLHQNMRLEAANDERTRNFLTWMQDIGRGVNIDSAGKITFDAEMSVETEEALIAKIYPELISSQVVPPAEFFIDRMILAPRNADVYTMNHTILDMMPGQERIYHSADEVLHEDGVDDPEREAVPVEVLRTICGSGIPPGELHVKVGCPVILLRNLDPSHGLCNGTRLVVVRMGERVIEGRILGGAHDGELAMIPRITVEPSDTINNLNFSFKRRQFPLQLAFSITINKAQGQSVKYVGLDLRVPVFAHGQLYVALSRVTSPSNISILTAEDTERTKTENVVYPEIVI